MRMRTYKVPHAPIHYLYMYIFSAGNKWAGIVSMATPADGEAESSSRSISRMLEASREMAEGARDEQGGRDSSGDEGWEENEVAPGQQLSDYRPSQQPLPSIQIASSIVAESDADSAPVPGTVIKHQASRDVLVVNDREVEWCGLQNMGNSCYMNAGLQCICSIPHFAAYFLDNVENGNDRAVHHSEGEGETVDFQRKENTKIECRSQLNSSFRVLLRKLWCGQFSSLHPRAFKMSLGLVHPPFAGTRQQDCQEFLAVLLDHIHEHLVDDHTPPAVETIVSRTFQGQLKNEVQCKHCHHISTKVEPFVYLSLPLPGAHQRHIEVYWVPAVRDTPSHLHVSRLMVTALKQDTIAELKSAVCELLGMNIERELLVTAEVKGGCISRPLGDGIALKQLTFTKGEKLYCFEMMSLSELTASIQREDPWAPSTADNHTPSDASDQKQSTDIDAFGSQPFTSGAGNNPMTSPMETDGTDGVGVTVSGASAVVMEWRSCCICLEEMLDSDLLTHPACGAVLCSSCLQSSMQHSSQQDHKTPCPICSMFVLLSEAFCPLSSRQQPTDQQVISFLQVVLLMRESSGSLFGHPVMLHLPCQAQGALYYKTIASLLPECLANAQWSLCLTDAKARYCSRCSYESFCSGCPLQRSTGSEVKLKPGDHVTVCFSGSLTSQQLHQANFVDDHSSYLSASTATTLTLNHCLEAFVKSEELGDDNPWYCSSCESQQKATRTLAVHHVPPVLIIHLKRFMYQSGGAKLEIPVEFPLRLEAKDVCSVSPPDAQPLHLTAIVCHFGTLQGGHYTAFVRRPATGSWLYCNDSQVSQSTPSSQESESVYILFYQRSSLGDGLDTSLFESWQFDDAAEMRAVEQLMLSVPPAPTIKQPPLKLKRTSSDPDINKSQTLIQPHKKQCNMSPF